MQKPAISQPTPHPERIEHWSHSHSISSRFVRHILVAKACYEQIASHRVAIAGAWLTEPLDLSNLTLRHGLSIAESRLENVTSLQNLVAPRSVDFRGSFIGTKERYLDMRWMHINGPLELGNARLHSTHQFNTVPSSLPGMDLSGSQIEGSLTIETASISGCVLLNNFRSRGNVDIRRSSLAGVQAFASSIGGQLVLVDNEFVPGDASCSGPQTPQINLFGSSVGQAVFLNRAIVPGQIYMRNVKVGSSVYMAGASLGSVDLGGTDIRGTLRLGYDGIKLTNWSSNATLDLRSSSIGVVEFTPDLSVWPLYIEFDGARYAHLLELKRQSGEPSATPMTAFPFSELLLRQRSYSPQPYNHLVRLLKDIGYEDAASHLQMQKKRRERIEAFRTGDVLSWLWLWALEILIGFGERLWLAVIWVAALVWIGARRVRKDPAARAKGIRFGYAYSLEMLIPFLKLRKLHADIDLESNARYYFYVHKVFGYILGTVLIAWVSGLTK